MDSDPNLLPRDKLLRDTFTPAETSLFIMVIAVANVAFWYADPRSFWLLGFLLIAGSLTPIILKTHEHTHPFFVTFLWPKFWLCTAPVWLLLLQFALGLAQRPLGVTTVEGLEFVKFERPPHSWLPTSTAAGSALLPVLGFCSIHILAVGLFIVPKSRAFFERLMPILCLSATLVAIFGYIQAGLDLTKPLLTKGTGAEDFFGFFPYEGHWAAFAILWCCASMAMSLLTTRYDDSPAFIQSTGPWYLAAGTLFGVSAFMIEAVWPAVLLTLTYAAMLLLFSIHFASDRRDPHRKQISFISGLAAIGMSGAGIFQFIQAAEAPAYVEELRRAGVEMFHDSPFFGWGFDSFGHLLPYYGSDLLGSTNFERASSDALQMLAELGLIGVLPGIILLVFLIGRYFKGRNNIQLTNHLIFGLVSVTLLAFLDSPFMSPAVFMSFVVILFVGLRWADVTRNRADEVDAPKPRLVTPESQRRVPFHTGSEVDKLR